MKNWAGATKRARANSRAKWLVRILSPCSMSRSQKGPEPVASRPGFAIAGKRVFVAGHRGMVGSAIVRRLDREQCDIIVAVRDMMDLKDQTAVRAFFERERPEAVFLAAARVGGILANERYPADFLYDNLMIEANVIEAAHRSGVGKLLFL